MNVSEPLAGGTGRAWLSAILGAYRDDEYDYVLERGQAVLVAPPQNARIAGPV
jgi:type IV secretory pathway protease TraF